MIRKDWVIGGLVLIPALALPVLSAQTIHSFADPAQRSRAVLPATAHASTAAASPMPAAGAQAVPQPGAPAISNKPATTTPAAMPAAAAQPRPVNASTGVDCIGGGCDLQPARISIATPPPATGAWLWQQRLAWGANLVLVVLGYIAILIALSVLRKIERQTQYAEVAAQAAAESAQTALALGQTMIRAERPWILMSVRPAQNIDNGFAVVATNRGRGPARILSTVDEIVNAVDETHLPEVPVYKNEPVALADPLILLPGETTEILCFSRAEVNRVCATEEKLARVEKWEEKIYLYGKVAYRDLAVSDNAPPHESSWFCWYIHGRQKSGMVMAGPPAYNRHT